MCGRISMLKYFLKRRVDVFLIAFLTQAFVFSAPAVSAERIALVIGNSSYSHASYLANPGNDARAVSAVLRSDGYDVTTELDLGVEAMRRALGVFASKASTADIALIYYAGHGIEVGGENFLIPTDARLLSDAEVEFETIPLDLLVRAAGRAKVLGLVILDACRNNPFAAKMRTVGGPRSVGRGLATVQTAGSNTLIAYAAAAGAVADDGAGTNSPYTAAFLEAWREPAKDVRLFFGAVKEKLVSKTGGMQEPFTYSSLGSAQILLKKVERFSPPFDVFATMWAKCEKGNHNFCRALIRNDGGTGYGRLASVIIDADLAFSQKQDLKNQHANEALGGGVDGGSIQPSPLKDEVVSDRKQLARSEVTLCHKMAADPNDENRHRGVSGVKEWDIEADDAIAACASALENEPDDPQLMYQLARAHSAKKSYKSMFPLLETSCNETYSRACIVLGSLYSSGEGTAKNDSKAYELWMKAAAFNNSLGMRLVAYALKTGEGVEKNLQLSETYYEKSCNLGNGFACGILGEQHRDAGNMERAAHLFDLSCSDNEVAGCNIVGGLHESKRLKDSSIEKALYYYHKACVLGSCDEFLRNASGNEAFPELVSICRTAHETDGSKDACKDAVRIADRTPLVDQVKVRGLRDLTCRNGYDYESCYALTDQLIETDDPIPSYQIVETRCKNGNERDCYFLAKTFFHNSSLNAETQIGLQTALAYMGKACAAGVAEACIDHCTRGSSTSCKAFHSGRAGALVGKREYEAICDKQGGSACTVARSFLSLEDILIGIKEKLNNIQITSQALFYSNDTGSIDAVYFLKDGLHFSNFFDLELKTPFRIIDGEICHDRGSDETFCRKLKIGRIFSELRFRRNDNSYADEADYIVIATTAEHRKLDNTAPIGQINQWPGGAVFGRRYLGEYPSRRDKMRAEDYWRLDLDKHDQYTFSTEAGETVGSYKIDGSEICFDKPLLKPGGGPKCYRLLASQDRSDSNPYRWAVLYDETVEEFVASVLYVATPKNCWRCK